MSVDGPYKERAGELYEELRSNLIRYIICLVIFLLKFFVNLDFLKGRIVMRLGAIMK